MKKELKDMFEYVQLTGGNEFLVLKCFESTSLRDTALIKVGTLHELLKHDMLEEAPLMFHWDVEKNDGETTTYFRKNDDAKRVRLKNLIEECHEVREFCKEFYSEYVI